MIADSLDLDPTNRNIASNLSLPYLTLYHAYDGLGEPARALENLRKAYHLSPSPQLKQILDFTELPLTEMGDTTASPDSSP